MNGRPSDGGQHIIPPHELKCVWMTAGVLSYQLCDREFDCENCPVDQAMHTHVRREVVEAHEPAADPPPMPAPRDQGLRADRLYSRNHCWVMRGESGAGADARVRVGLEPGLAAALLTPRSVVHTESGTEVEKGNSHLWVVTAGGTFGVSAPLSGTLQESNALLHDRPYLLGTQPLDEGWLYMLRVRSDSKELEGLMGPEAARCDYDLDRRRLREELRKVLHAGDATVTPVALGVESLQGIADTLGPQRYFAILRQVYG